ncbi:Uncharacterized protein TPAR_01664 [Tolypocladium paradoxum]|uniref:Amidoligase enzyme n=1 Tax=Tolypocladium paradoxum TaxID=94208 RepID=A0A2S4L6U6_9HYPO|nr:Uncharacterized protein TPAR_01664 [Tolypocladium paradoxum]
MASSSSSASVPTLAFGVEIELLVRPRSSFVPELLAAGWDRAVVSPLGEESRLARNRNVLRHAIASRLTNAKIPATTNADEYRGWTVADEGSLDELEGLWRLELISRKISTDEDWQVEFHQVFQLLDQLCEVRLTSGCSMHVHVSPSKDLSRTFTMPELRNIMKAMAYYDDAVTRVMPPRRKNNPWATSNMVSEKTAKNVRDAHAAVRHSSWGPLFRIFDEVKAKAQIPLQLFNDKFIAWNFKNLTGCGTVEFRRPPGVQTAEAARFWTGLTLAFVRQAMDTKWDSYQTSRSHPTVEHLREFISRGFTKLERTCQGALDVRELAEDPSPATRFSSAEIRAIDRKKAMKERQGGGFAQKANSRPNTPSSSSGSSSSRR